MCKSDIDLEKYWVTHSGYFKLATTVAFGTGIKYGKIILYHEISKGSVDKKISIREYNNREVY